MYTSIPSYTYLGKQMVLFECFLIEEGVRLHVLQKRPHKFTCVCSCKNEAHVQIDNGLRYRVEVRLHKKHCSKTTVGALNMRR